MRASNLRPGGRSRHRRTTAGSLIAFALLAVSCSSDAESTTSSSTTSEPVTTTQLAATTTVAEVEDEPAALSGLDGAIGDASDLVLSWFNGAPFSEADYEASFDQNFRDAIGFGDLTPLLDQVTLDAPYRVEEVQESTTTQAAILIVGVSEMPALLSIAVATADDPTMIGLFIGPADQLEFETPASPADAVARLEDMGTVRLAAFDTDCSAGAVAQSPDVQAPIGSGFKLWVLGAVVASVEDGTITWDDEVAVRDELDSIPSGTTQNDPDGTLLTVRELAERMIEVSDNTATDHLMDLVGREAVEEAMIATGHDEPMRNIPMMNTREFTIVKFSSEELRARYIGADTTERRRILGEDVATMDLPPLSNITTVVDPINVETLEWFASPTDLCAALTQLAADEEATAILTRNPGMPDTTGVWDSILYKGGSEPGVFAMAWLVIDGDGNSSVLAGSVANEDELIDEFEAANLFAYLRDNALPR